MSELINNYIAVDVICAFSLMILIHASRCNVFFIPEMKKQFALAAYITIVVITSQIGSVIFENGMVESSVPAFIANVIGFSLSPFIAIILSKTFSADKRRIGVLITIPAWINVAFVISSPWSGLIFSIHENNYMRGPWFGIYIVAYLFAYAVLIVESFKAMKSYQCHTKSTFTMLFAFTVAGTSVQIIWPNVHTSWLCITLSLILYYVYFCELSETQDTLTGLLNRNVYDQHLKNLSQNTSGSVIIFDLDDFKLINDPYGHQWGDFCLQMIGTIIKDCFLHMGACYRVGGDEFCVICRTTDEQELENILGLFHRKIDEMRTSRNLQNTLPTVSTGYAVFYNLERGYTAVMKEADAQMYHFKNERKIKKLSSIPLE